VNANSAAKISQINQLAANATSFKTLDDASASITKTGISAKVAASTTDSNRWTTRPESSCSHTTELFDSSLQLPASGTRES
jgi:hypothetical protein